MIGFQSVKQRSSSSNIAGAAAAAAAAAMPVDYDDDLSPTQSSPGCSREAGQCGVVAGGRQVGYGLEWAIQSRQSSSSLRTTSARSMQIK